MAVIVVNFDRAGHTVEIELRAGLLCGERHAAVMDVQRQTVRLDVPGRDAVALVLAEGE